MRNICLIVLVTMICAAAQAGLPETVGVSGGVAVVVGDFDAKTLVSLRGEGRFTVQGLTRDQKRIDSIRAELKIHGLYGKIAVDVWDGKNLPFVDNFANLIVADKSVGLSSTEALRALCPLGVYCVKSSDGLKTTKKPTFPIGATKRVSTFTPAALPTPMCALPWAGCACDRRQQPGTTMRSTL